MLVPRRVNNLTKSFKGSAINLGSLLGPFLYPSAKFCWERFVNIPLENVYKPFPRVALRVPKKTILRISQDSPGFLGIDTPKIDALEHAFRYFLSNYGVILGYQYYLPKLKYFTNLDFPEIAGVFPYFSPPFGGNRSCFRSRK